MTRHKSLRSLELLVEEGDNVTVTFTLVNRAVAAMLLKSILDAAVVQFSVLVLQSPTGKRCFVLLSAFRMHIRLKIKYYKTKYSA